MRSWKRHLLRNRYRQTSWPPSRSKSAPSKIRQSQESASEKHPSASGEAEKHEVATEDGSNEQAGAKRSRPAEANELIEVDECARLYVDDV